MVEVKKAVLAGAGIVVGIGVLYGADLLLTQGQVPRGATVGGVEIGGMDPSEAQALLEREIDPSAPVEVQAGDLRSSFNPAASGVMPDWKATIDGAGKQALNPITRVRSFFSTYEIPVASTVDEALLRPQVDRIRAELSPEPVEAGLNLAGGKVNVDPQPANGQKVEGVEQALIEQWPEGVELEPEVTHPELDQKAVEKALPAAEQAVSSPYVIHGRDADGVIPPERMAEVVSFERLEPKVNVEAAQHIFEEGLGPTERPLRNAKVNYPSMEVTPHSDGVSIEWEATLKGFDPTTDQPREREAVYKDEKATYTTEMAQQASFDDVVGEFTTGGYSDASGVNIARVAQMVNGAFVAPGETFSLNGYTEPRGTAQGFVESGVILNGRADKAVGGGISQFATTLYNAAYFAGMQDVAHTPHSYYISRYPAGREATVYEGAIDLQFKNDSPNPVIIQTSAGGGQVTVKLLGVKTVNVESVNGGRWAYTSPQVMQVSGANCTPSSGAQGFSTSDTRIIKNLSGAEISRETQTTVYDPQPIVRCS
ncbi:VanW family protein [Corynebacterium pelargi]|uniref:VanW family protein n=1 Tax=Corynebacterium pelargi TaxID=1471400 RepID=UPI001E39BA38|nr:VanW family protein [Corynebacterium pelargi]